MHFNFNNFLKITFTLLVFAVPSSLFLGKFYLQTTNTLENNQHWKSSKMELQKGVIGAVAYFITPIGLVQNRLNLDPWLGYQEVLYREKIDPQQISFDLALPEGSYFSFIYNKNEKEFSGIRLSRSPFYKSLYFIAENEGKFIKTEPIEINELREINQFRIVFEKNQFSFYLNGALIKLVGENLSPPFYIGFRGGPNRASVDNIKIELKNSNRVIQEDFKNKKSPILPLFACVVIILLLNLLIYLNQNKKIKINSTDKPIYFVLTFNFVVLMASIVLYTAQLFYLPKNYYFSKYYFSTIAFLRNYKSSMDNRGEVIDYLRKTYSPENPSKNFRILFVGTSQTWGSGATKESDTFVRRLEKRLNEENSSNTPYEFINTGIVGEGSARLWKPYSKEWIQLNPKIVIMDLSNNDTDPSEFSKYLEKYARLNQSKGIKTIFILEANAIDQVRPYFPENHQIMKDMAKKYDFSLIDLHHCLLEKYDSGFLWWDFVHPTSYGHQLAAECIYPTLANVIQKTPY